MGGANCDPIIRNMTWSYSRIMSFRDCPYRWFLKYVQPKRLIRRVFHSKRPGEAEIGAAYIRGDLDMDDVGILRYYLGFERKTMFFANYGTFMHELLEMYCKGEKTREQLCDMYMQQFKDRVKGQAPNRTVFANYFKSGIQYLRELRPFPYRMIGVEKKVSLDLDGIPFIGYVDYIGENDQGLVIIDHKSKVLRSRSKRARPTKSDAELDDHLIQLYLYAAAVEQEFGEKPRTLCFNCFRVPELIEEPFKDEAYAASKKWLSDEVEAIKSETAFRPNAEFFKCKHICELQDFCTYRELSERR